MSSSTDTDASLKPVSRFISTYMPICLYAIKMHFHTAAKEN